MGNILTAEVTITGMRPLLWHAFGPDSIPLEKQERTGVAGNDPEEWKKTYMATKEGQLFFPPTYLFSTIREGAKYTSRKRGTLQSFVSATLQVTDDRVLVDRWIPEPLTSDPDELVYLDIRSVRNPTTKARNVRYRIAAATGWNITFHLLWDKTIISRAEMEAVVIDAGRLVGLADGRTIGFGRFEKTAFTVGDL
jgi:hypothetical protein